MSAERNRPSASIIALAVALLLLPVIYFGYVLLRSNPQVQAAIIAFVAVIFTAIWTQFEIKKREIRATLFPEKREAYLKIIKLIVDMLKDQKTGQVSTDISSENTDLMTKVFDLKQALLVWGNSEIIRLWNKFESFSTDEPANNRVALMEEILREIRKDLGHDDKKLPFGSLWGLFLNREAKVEVFGDKILQ